MFPQPVSPNGQPPDEVKNLIAEYQANKAGLELFITDGYFVLYEKIVTKGEDGQPDTVSLGKFLKRAYWSDAQFMSQEMLRLRLRL